MKNRNYTFTKRCLAMILSLAMIFGLLPAIAMAAEDGSVSAAVSQVSDPGTVNAYQNLLGNFSDGNRYAGRLWTDKSVFSDYDKLAEALGGELTASQLEQLGIGLDEFMVLYSALGSTTSVFTETTVGSNLDVVIVLDNSGSMSSSVIDASGNRVTRLQAVVDAANSLIEGILKNPSNRLAVVAYSADASVLLNLDSYDKTSSCLTNSGGNLSAKADSLTDGSTNLQGNTIRAHQTGTNVQSGINEGMKILNNAENVEGRTPVIIVMTDGAANYAAYQDMLGDTSTGGNYKQPSGSSTTADVVLSTLLNAAYWKYTLSQKYGTNMKAFTVGVDITELANASIVVNPGDFFHAESTTNFSTVALNMLELYTEWTESNSAVTGSASGRGSSRYTWTFPQPATAALKDGIENNIVYADEYYEVDSADLLKTFDDILVKISNLQDAFQAIEKTDITNGESSMAYVDFIGDYMELKDFKGISLYGQFYHVVLGGTVSNTNADGTITTVYTYKVVDNGEAITDPLSGEKFLLSENVVIELKHTYKADSQGNRISAGEQDLWIHIDESVLPLIYHKVETKNENTTYTVYAQVPVRFYYTVGISEYVAPGGNLLLHRMDAAYVEANTVNGVLYFYANQYFAQDDDEVLVNHTPESGHGDAHTAITPDTTNRYYIHQYNVPIFISIRNTNGDAVTMEPGSYGVEYNDSYVTQIMTYANLADLDDTTDLYTLVHFHVPTGQQTGTTADGGAIYAGQEKTYFFFADWGNMLNDVAFYDSVNGVYINADGSVSATEGKWDSRYTYQQYIDTVAAYIAATDGVSAEDIQAYMAIGSWRIQRFANRTFGKTENPTDTAALRIAPVLNTDDETEHEGSIVIWLGNNGRIGYTAQTPKTVTDESGNDIDGQLVVIGDVLTYTITATNYEDGPATIVITDRVPTGTAYVEGSATPTAVNNYGQLIWTLENVAVGETVTVSYQVLVTGENMSVIANTAYITIGNNPTYETNTTTNPPVGKTSGSSQYTPEGEVQVGDILTYTIYYHNNTDATAEIRILDTIPTGTTYVPGSASYSGTDVLTLTEDANGNVTALNWIIEQVPAGQSGSVHFQVRINADAANPIDNAAEITIGDNGPIIVTNEVVDELAYGDLTLRKIVAAGNADGSQDRYFTLVLQSAIEGISALEGTFAVTGSSKHTTVTFVNGAAELQIKHGETVTIADLPAGITVTVYEQAAAGYTPVYSADAVNIVANETVAVDITNIYNVKPVSVILEGTKVLHGMNLQANSFSFLVYDAQGNVAAGASNAADGTITFSAIQYAAVGEYVYTVVETQTGASGVSYDATVYTVTVTVVDDGNGNLSASVTYPAGGMVFTNTYTPKEVQVELNGVKHLTGEAADGIAAGEYSFDVYAYNIVTGEVGALVSAGTTPEGQTSAVISFANLGFTLKDLTDDAGNILASKDFHFLVVEDIPAANGPTFDPNMYYDPTEYLVKITVSYDANTGILSATAPVYSVLGSNGVAVDMTFSNVQNPDSVQITPVGNKTTLNAPDGITFSFTVINLANQVEAGVGVGQANGSITFTTLTYTEPGTYNYLIRESNAGNTTNGITYDDAVFYMTVVVTRDSYKKLVATVSYTDADGNAVDAPAFENQYNAAGYINITATKQLSGRDINAGEFAFALVRQDNNGEIDGIVAADGTITFATLYYSSQDIPAGQDRATIHYVMHEVIPEATKLPGVVYDTREYDVYITIVDNGDGTIQAFLSDAAGNPMSSATETGIVFANSYSVTTGTDVTITVGKELNGRDLASGEFTFVLYRYDAGSWKNVASALNNADGVVSFVRHFNASTLGHLAFEDDGTFTVLYRIDEVNNYLGGITYDTSSIYVQVVIRHDEQTASYSIDSVGYFSDEACQNELSEPKFVNTYTTSDITLTPMANKVLVGRELANGEFSFIITDSTGRTVSYGTNDANGNIVFTDISFTAAGEYTFTMREVAGNLGGVTYVTEGVTFTVTVTDNGDGTLTAVANYPAGGITFANTYSPNPVTVQPNAVKVLDGKNLIAGDFTFVLTDAEGNTWEATNNANGAVVFPTITYTQPGTYTYTIHEKAGTDSRYTYSETIYNITVVVLDDGNGNLYAEYHIYRAGTEVGAVTFYNQFTLDPVTLDLNDEIDFVKIMQDPAGTGIGAAGFQFYVYNWDGEQVSYGLSDASGNIDFEPDLIFTGAGEYHFRVVEADEQANGVSYDTTVWVLTVEVDFNADTGMLYINGIYYAVEKSTEAATGDIEFVNSYDPTPAEVTLQLNKTLTGRDLVAGEFTFYLMSGNTKVAEATNDADGNVIFHLTFDHVGTYVYTVVEAAGDKGGVSYDDSVQTVTVTVTDVRGEGKLEAVAVITQGDGVFENEYTPANTTLTLTARKVMVGRELKEGEFTFLMTDANGNTYEATNTRDGIVTFETLTYTQPGTYVYTITEQAGDLGGVTYSTRVYTATVTVYDDLEGNLVATVVYTYVDSNGVRQTIAEPLFGNFYSAAEGEIELLARKVLHGRALKDGEFTFLLTDAEGNVIEAVNAANGVVTFGVFTFTEIGTYTYTITEKAGDVSGVTYSELVYTVTVEVTDDLQGNLVAEVTYSLNGETAAEALFTNIYDAADEQVMLQAFKTLTGRELKEGEFTFLLTDAGGNVIEAVNAADGTVTFETITYTEAGTYIYTLIEKAGDKGGVAYSELVYTVTVVVTDDQAGNLVAEVTYSLDGEAVEKAAFTNTYTTNTTQITLEALKTLTGRELLGGEFTFVLTDAEGNVIEAVNAADGTVTFETITYTEPGTYVYTLAEKAGEVGGVTYSDAVYTVTVVVTDDLQGNLTAEATYSLNGEEVETASFANHYEAADVQVMLQAFKTLIGRELLDGEFTFLLTDAEGNVIEAVNAADGTVTFETITYTEAGTYIYTLAEKAGDKGGVTYSDVVYTVTVVVTDDLQGNLVAEVRYSLNGEAVENAAFTNTYASADVQITLEALKTLTGKVLEEGAFTFVLTDAEGNVIEAVNTAEGIIRFADILFTEAGTYTFTLSESLGEEAFMVYDETVYTIQITVIDNGNGQLKIAQVLVNEEQIAVEAGIALTGIEFVNVYNYIPQTGDTMIVTAMFFMSFSVFALAVLLLAQKQRRIRK